MLAKLTSPNGMAVIATATGAHNYRLVGLELSAPANVYTFGLISLGSGTETSLAQIPYSIELDRLYLHGDPVAGGKRGITLNSRSTKITGCWISDIKSTYQETQAIGGWNGPGPFVIENNYLEASGVNIMFGGAKASIAGLVPSDIVFRRNYVTKPLSWNPADPTYKGIKWSVKNLFELKNARRVTIDSNIFENNWAGAQNGFGILFTVRTEAGTMPWAVVEDITMSNNILRNSEQAINLAGRDGSYGGALRRVTIKNNVFEKIKYRYLQVLNACENTVVDHNTIFHGSLLVAFDGLPSPGFVYRNNLSAKGTYGLFGNGKGEGSAAIASYAPNAVISKNVIAGAAATSYPAGNYYPASIYDARFVDVFGGNYTLATDSPYRLLGTDAKDIGAGVTALTAATTGVIPTL
jgi:hypothetical protein